MKTFLVSLLALCSLSLFAAPGGEVECDLDFYSSGKILNTVNIKETVDKLNEDTYQERLYFTSENGRFSFEIIAQINLGVAKKKSITVWMRDNKMGMTHDTESIGRLTDGKVESRFKQFDKDGGYNYGTEGYVGVCSLNFNI